MKKAIKLLVVIFFVGISQLASASVEYVSKTEINQNIQVAEEEMFIELNLDEINNLEELNVQSSGVIIIYDQVRGFRDPYCREFVGYFRTIEEAAYMGCRSVIIRVVCIKVLS